MELSNLTDLDLSNNMLVGEVPRGIGTLTKLTSLSLQYNKFTGSLSEEHFDCLVSLKSLDLSHNPLKMEMGLNWSPPFRLIQANFADIQMGPPFPTWLKQQENIEDLDISHAGSGHIPKLVLEHVFKCHLPEHLYESDQCQVTIFTQIYETGIHDVSLFKPVYRFSTTPPGTFVCFGSLQEFFIRFNSIRLGHYYPGGAGSFFQ